MARACRAYLRSVDRALPRAPAAACRSSAAPIRFGSWIGGDRDGNPNVTPDVTRAGLPARAVDGGGPVSARDRGAARRTVDGRRHRRAASARPATRASRIASCCAACARGSPRRATGSTAVAARARRDHAAAPTSYLDADELAAPLRLVRRVARATGNDVIADGRLADLLRRVAAFGLTLAPLDIRQESAGTRRPRRDHRALGLGPLRRVGRSDARRVPRCASSPGAPAADRRGPPDAPRDGARRARHVPDRSRACRPDRSAPTSSPWRAARPTCSRSSCCRRRPASRHPLRVVPLFETSRDLEHAGARARRAARARRGTAQRIGGPPGSDDRLLRFGEGRRPARGELGSVQGAGGDRRRLPAARRRRSRCSTAAAAASAAAAGRPTWRSCRSRPARSTARCASPSRAR